MPVMWWSHIDNIDFAPVAPRIFGADPGDENEDNKPKEDEAGGAGGGQGNQDGDPQKKIAALTDEKDRHWRASQEAAKQLETVSAELEELRKFKEEAENAKLGDDEKVQKKLEELSKDNTAKDEAIASLTHEIERLLVNNAFLAVADVTWHDPETALQLVDLSQVKIAQKEGKFSIENPDALGAAVKALAEKKPYLVNKTQVEDEEKQELPKTGDKPSEDKSKKLTERQKLEQKYPAIRR